MNYIKVELKNCYGIGQLTCDFDFSQRPAHAVYAPNGFMKTSFARTLADLSQGKSPSDLMFPDRTPAWRVTDETDAEVPPEQILVIPPYREGFEDTHVSTLLVREDLRGKYEAARRDLDARRNDLVSALRQRAKLQGTKLNPEVELCTAFEVEDIVDGLDAMIEAAKAAEAELADVEIGAIFNDKALEFLRRPDTLSQLEKYVEQLTKLLSESPILTPQFTHTEANTVQKALDTSRFFEASHWLTLNENGTPVEIRDAQALRDRVEGELKKVLADKTLQKSFGTFDKAMVRNAELRKLREYVHEHRHLLPRLIDLARFRRDVWAALLAEQLPLLERLRDQFVESRDQIARVVNEAQAQASDWSAVVDLFNRRFNVPFRLRVENQADVILRAEAPRLVFDFLDSDGEVEVSAAGDLLRVLSQGERRALYLLNVLFEVRVKERSGRPILLVVDDIADSFDYRNKYAILEYLRDLKESGRFRLIILTHNYDFHRSAASRLNVGRPNRWLAVRTRRSVRLVEEHYQGNVFETLLKKAADSRMFLAAIPFVRNLAEYCGLEEQEELLTEVLHMKERTRALALADLDQVYQAVVRGKYEVPSSPSRDTRVLDLLESTARDIASSVDEHAELEAKLVLSMAIRLKAEEHMIGRIADDAAVQKISSNQTMQLVRLYQARGCGTAEELAILDTVQLMTPENIHLNTFMFEPILDLGIGHLRKLYEEVCGLGTGAGEPPVVPAGPSHLDLGAA